MLTRSQTEAVIGQVKFKDHTGFATGVMGNGLYIQHWQQIPDCVPVSSEFPRADEYEKVIPEPQYGRKWYISPHMVVSEIVQTCLMAVIAFEEHEVREQFKYRDVVPFGPHVAVNALMDAGHYKDVREPKPKMTLKKLARNLAVG